MTPAPAPAATPARGQRAYAQRGAPPRRILPARQPSRGASRRRSRTRDQTPGSGTEAAAHRRGRTQRSEHDSARAQASLRSGRRRQRARAASASGSRYHSRCRPPAPTAGSRRIFRPPRARPGRTHSTTSRRILQPGASSTASCADRRQPQHPATRAHAARFRPVARRGSLRKGRGIRCRSLRRWQIFRAGCRQSSQGP
jgi:hypothetical protein